MIRRGARCAAGARLRGRRRAARPRAGRRAAVRRPRRDRRRAADLRGFRHVRRHPRNGVGHVLRRRRPGPVEGPGVRGHGVAIQEDRRAGLRRRRRGVLGSAFRRPSLCVRSSSPPRTGCPGCGASVRMPAAVSAGSATRKHPRSQRRRRTSSDPTRATRRGGRELRIWRWIGAGAEVRYRAVSDAIGEGGVSKEVRRSDLGGTSVRVRVILSGAESPPRRLALPRLSDDIEPRRAGRGLRLVGTDGALCRRCRSQPDDAVSRVPGSMDLGELGFDGVVPEATGRPAYHPSVLLKLYIYGYLNRVQSSRRLEREAGRNVEVMWLTRSRPRSQDHRGLPQGQWPRHPQGLHTLRRAVPRDGPLVRRQRCDRRQQVQGGEQPRPELHACQDGAAACPDRGERRALPAAARHRRPAGALRCARHQDHPAERLCCGSSGLPWCLVSQDGVEDDEEFAHAGGDGDFPGPAACDQALEEGLQRRGGGWRSASACTGRCGRWHGRP